MSTYIVGDNMKVFINNKVYVQKCDIAYILKGVEGTSFPISIIDVFGSTLKPFGEDMNDFVEFSSKEEKAFFKRCDWIIDYDFFRDMSEDDIVNYRAKLIEDKVKMVKDYNELASRIGEKKLGKERTKIELMDHKIWSVKEILLYKKGTANFVLPGKEKGNVFHKIIRNFKQE